MKSNTGYAKEEPGWVRTGPLAMLVKKAVSLLLSEEALETDIRTNRIFLVHCVPTCIIASIFVFTDVIISSKTS